MAACTTQSLVCVGAGTYNITRVVTVRASTPKAGVGAACLPTSELRGLHAPRSTARPAPITRRLHVRAALPELISGGVGGTIPHPPSPASKTQQTRPGSSRLVAVISACIATRTKHAASAPDGKAVQHQHALSTRDCDWLMMKRRLRGAVPVMPVVGTLGISFMVYRAVVYSRIQYITAALLGNQTPRGASVLEIGVGGGKNLYYYPVCASSQCADRNRRPYALTTPLSAQKRCSCVAELSVETSRPRALHLQPYRWAGPSCTGKQRTHTQTALAEVLSPSLGCGDASTEGRERDRGGPASEPRASLPGAHPRLASPRHACSSTTASAAFALAVPYRLRRNNGRGGGCTRAVRALRRRVWCWTIAKAAPRLWTSLPTGTVGSLDDTWSVCMCLSLSVGVEQPWRLSIHGHSVLREMPRTKHPHSRSRQALTEALQL
jgi:hypothetical protein